jgi:hypothetical protein
MMPLKHARVQLLHVAVRCVHLGSEADIQLTSKMSAKFHKRRANVVGKGVESGLKNRLV